MREEEKKKKEGSGDWNIFQGRTRPFGESIVGIHIGTLTGRVFVLDEVFFSIRLLYTVYILSIAEDV